MDIEFTVDLFCLLEEAHSNKVICFTQNPTVFILISLTILLSWRCPISGHLGSTGLTYKISYQAGTMGQDTRRVRVGNRERARYC